MKTLPMLTLLLVTTSLAHAGGKDVYADFYQAKKLGTTPSAFTRADENLRQVRPGMSEGRFLETMGMEVLASHKRPFDARMDGYLPVASRQASTSAGGDERHLVFGWIESGREMPRVEVTVVWHKVKSVERLGGMTAAAEPEAPPAAAPEETAIASRETERDAM